MKVALIRQYLVYINSPSNPDDQLFQNISSLSKLERSFLKINEIDIPVLYYSMLHSYSITSLKSDSLVIQFHLYSNNTNIPSDVLYSSPPHELKQVSPKYQKQE